MDVPQNKTRQAVSAAVIGNVLEWYDFAVYAYVAAYIAKNFFPQGDPVTALVRPESVDVEADPAGTGRVLAVSFLGPTARVTVSLPDDMLVVAQTASARLPELTPGTAVRVTLRPVPVVVSPA